MAMRMVKGISIVALFGHISAAIAADEPKYGGTLEVVSISPSVSALSWDNYDWIWKHNWMPRK